MSFLSQLDFWGLPGIDLTKKYKLYPEDPFLIVIFAVGFFVVRKLFVNLCFVPLANYLRVPKSVEKRGSSTTRYQKFIENAWYSVYYPFSVIVTLYVLWGQHWFPSYDRATAHSPHFEVVRDLDYVYLMQIGYYIQLLINLVFIDEKLDDFAEMLTHHLVTIFLVSFSYVGLWHRMGSLIFFIHDISDVFLYWAKLSHNAKWDGFASGLFFPLFVVSFFFTRLIYFPLLIRACWNSDAAQSHTFYQYLPHLSLDFTQEKGCIGGHCISTYLLMIYSTLALLTLHVFWFYRIVLLVISTVKNNGIVPGDPRYEKQVNGNKNI